MKKKYHKIWIFVSNSLLLCFLHLAFCLSCQININLYYVRYKFMKILSLNVKKTSDVIRKNVEILAFFGHKIEKITHL